MAKGSNLGRIVRVNMTSSIGRLLVGIDEVAAVINNACTARIDQCLYASFITCTDDVSRSFNIHAKEQLLVSFSHGRDWWRSGMDDNSWLYLLEDVQ